MHAFWRKPFFWIFLMLLVTIPLVSFLTAPYFKKNVSLGSPSKTQSSIPVSPSIPQPGSCLILEEKYCILGKQIDFKNTQGQPEIYVGFHLPPNVPIFAGMDGQVLKAKISQPSARQGLLATIRDPNLGNPNAMAFDTVGDLQFNDMSTANVKKGDIIGYTQDTGIKNYGDYNLVVTIRRLDPDNKIILTDKQMLYKLFLSIKQ